MKKYWLLFMVRAWGTLESVSRAYWRWRARRAKAVVLHFDDMMRRGGMTRTERRQFWREFTKREAVREHFMGV